MEERTLGIILRTRPFSETSLIVHWLTPDLGRLSTLAKGALRPKSPFRGKLDLFYLAEIRLYLSRRSELHTLCEVSLRDSYPALREDLMRLQQAAYCAGLIEQTTEIQTPLPGYYALFRGLLDQLSRSPPQDQTIFAFELKLLRELGQAPNLQTASLPPGAKHVLAELNDLDWPALSSLCLTIPQLRWLRHYLQRLLLDQLGRVPAGRSTALAGI
jgi:DNA repair protein RecO (recombination protein O)